MPLLNTQWHFSISLALAQALDRAGPLKMRPCSYPHRRVRLPQNHLPCLI
jgi:hypothetical protein